MSTLTGKTGRLVMLAFLLLATSCSYKHTVYLQDMDTQTTYIAEDRPESQIRKGDILRISVACKSPALAAPFNLKSSVENVDPVTNETTYSAAENATQGYFVDEKGNINFPVLGMLHVEGRTLSEVRNWIKDLIIKSDYIKEPMVSAEFVNFQYTIIGEAQAGNHIVPSGSVNMFEALANAGDLGGMADRSDIWVIRTVDGTRKVYSINLLSKSCYDSPAFYLQQNDMVLVKPLRGKRDERMQSVYTTLSLALSFVGVASTFLVWMKL